MSEREALDGPASQPRGGLKGKRIVVTRPRAQADELASPLVALGAHVVVTPLIRIAAPPDWAALREAARGADRFDSIVFTSANAVGSFCAALREIGEDLGSLRDIPLCAIGPATAAALRSEGAAATLIPSAYIGEAVTEALAAAMELRGSRILYPRAEIARAVIPEDLRAKGAEVVEVVAYRTEPDPQGASELLRHVREKAIDLITFTSGSAVQSFAERVGATELGAAEVASIGPVTTAKCRALGIPVALEAEAYSAEGLVAKIIEYYTKAGRG